MAKPGCNSDIKAFVEARQGGVFDLYEKLEVNGKGETPLYTWCKSRATGLVTNSIKWNFTKFLVRRDGVTVTRYGPMTSPAAIASDIAKAIDADGGEEAKAPTGGDLN